MGTVCIDLMGRVGMRMQILKLAGLLLLLGDCGVTPEYWRRNITPWLIGSSDALRKELSGLL